MSDFQKLFESFKKKSFDFDPQYRKRHSKPTLTEIYTVQQKHESNLLHTYVLNEFLTADR